MIYEEIKFFKKSRLQNLKIKIILKTILLSLILAASTLLLNSSLVDASQTRILDAKSMIVEISQQIEAGNLQTIKRLERIGFKNEVNEIIKLEKEGRHYNFSTRTLIETLHQRAELTELGEGDRLLRVLYDDAAKNSAQLSKDPAFEWLRDKFSTSQLNLKQNPIKFASMQELANIGEKKKLPKSVVLAINKLADSFAEPHISRVKLAMIRNLNLGKEASQKFERSIARSSNRRQALASIFNAHVPPPRVEKAVRNVIKNLQAGSAFMQLDPQLMSVIDKLSKASEIPEELSKFTEVADNLQSRAKQMAQASSIGEPGKYTKANANFEKLAIELSDPIDNIIPKPVVPTTANHIQARILAQTYAKQMLSRMGTGIVNKVTNNYRAYTSKAFKGVSRSYRTAIRLPSLARGIAIGGGLDIGIDEKPIRAIWVPNESDDRFGRIFVEYIKKMSWLQSVLHNIGLGKENKREIAVSRVMFSDSFFSAAAILLENEEKNAIFREGELIILMSMDPDLKVSGPKTNILYQRSEALRNEIKETIDEAREEALEEVKFVTHPLEQQRIIQKHHLALRRKMFPLQQQSQAISAQLPRGIVLHPAIQGRELAWSTSRVDFWFNDLGGLSKESLKINGGMPLPKEFMDIEIVKASTWQFYERSHKIKLLPSKGKHANLEVVSHGNQLSPSVSSHFSVSMFAYSRERPIGGVAVDNRDDVFRLPTLERELQPLLDWLATNHHDFIRLNHFSEALSILRWIKRDNAPTLIFGINGEASPIAIPDRVYIKDGPAVKER